MPAMLRSKPSGAFSGKTDNDQSTSAIPDNYSEQHAPRPSSRLASFAPFRRSAMLNGSSGSSSSSGGPPSPTKTFQLGGASSSSMHSRTAAPAGTSGLGGFGGVADVPSINRSGGPLASSSSSSMSKIPFKPPKPAALRVKKAKALSISLLSGHANPIDAPKRDQEATNSRSVAIPAAHTAIPSTLQEALAAEDGMQGRYPAIKGQQRDKFPPRSASAFDFYRVNGPTKGLASKDWSAQQRTGQGLPVRMAPLSLGHSASKDAEMANLKRARNEELVIIGRHAIEDPEAPSFRHERRRSASLSLEPSAASAVAAEAGKKGQRSNDSAVHESPAAIWNLDTARELLSNPPSASMGNEYTDGRTGKAPTLTSPRSTASPFLNKFPAQAKLQAGSFQGDQGTSATRSSPIVKSRPSSSSSSSGTHGSPSRIPRHRASAFPLQQHHLGKADIIRSTHRMSSDSFASDHHSPRSSSSPSLSHRTANGSATAEYNSSPTKTKKSRPSMRIRTQSHAFGAPIEFQQSSEDVVIPQHPLSAQAKFFSIRSDGVLSDKQDSMGQSNGDKHELLPPPSRTYQISKVRTHDDLTGIRTRIDDPRLRSTHSTANGTALHNIGQQIGGMGAAVGKRGWDMFKNWSGSTGAGQNRRMADVPRRTSILMPSNEATRRWLTALNEPVGPSSTGGRVTTPSSGRGIFGRPLREAVLLTRLGSEGMNVIASRPDDHTLITSLDLGTEFKVDLPAVAKSPTDTKFGPGVSKNGPVDRHVARMKYLPGIVVRCIEAVEVWGIEEEGIYRLSGRASHTAKLRQIFHNVPTRSSGGNASAPLSDLRLVEIGTAELDLNSVTSLLKTYLRELPDSLIPEPHASHLNGLLQQKCGITAVGVSQTFGMDEATKQLEKAAAIKSDTQKSEMGEKIAEVIAGPLCALPSENWYLLRELSMHLGDLTMPQVVVHTRMPLSNLCLVLAPTLSLSVPLLRAMVEHRTLIFGQASPPADGELDQLVSTFQAPTSTRPTHSTDSPTKFSAPRMQTLTPTDFSKRTSISTVTDKRRSTSSVATVQPNDAFILSPITGHIPTALLEEDDPELVHSPIAAKFIRQRSDSISGSIGIQSVDSEGSRSLRRPSAASAHFLPSYTRPVDLNFGVDGDLNAYSPEPPSNDGLSSAASSINPGSSADIPRRGSGLASSIHESLNISMSNASIQSAIDRPRPPTGTSARFLSGRPSGERVGGGGGGGASTRSHRKGGSDATMSASSSSSSLSGSFGVHGPPTMPFTPSSSSTTDPGVIDGGSGAQTARTSPLTEKMVDDAPMDVKAVRQWWTDRRAD